MPTLYIVDGTWHGRRHHWETHDRELADRIAAYWGYPVVVAEDELHHPPLAAGRRWCRLGYPHQPLPGLEMPRRWRCAVLPWLDVLKVPPPPRPCCVCSACVIGHQPMNDGLR